ncbi:MAG: NFACT RNA binding domain-containing protein [Vicinamibacteria bacterium]
MKPSEPGEAGKESVARRFTSKDGMEVLVGRTASDNDLLTFRVASPRDFWLHVAGTSGSHVIVRNPEGLPSLPRDTLRFAAGLAARHSKAKSAGVVSVHVAQVKDVSKPRGAPPGQVSLKRYRSVRASVPSEGVGAGEGASSAKKTSMR